MSSDSPPLACSGAPCAAGGRTPSRAVENYFRNPERKSRVCRKSRWVPTFDEASALGPSRP
eukprot:807740-Amorphochlora_amoeboformis.AAC.1